ncbi:tyrosine-type recombinase/integrase [Phreatobacter stygius]|uniref:DUF4102 domain-containing protein n=1 Tax=Phreatobacter stygius TaxID=1940610 RepID=A0A4D7B4H0_9HYPH|nr:integrase arm-type DNA-binding domain-containing protein [Phreatobacter stygius]QCI64576.1 DUF4102 domain-containing protein [Phreatobacter stygius]
MALTDVAIRNLKPGAKPKKLSDEKGLHVLVTPQGSKLWRLAYRFDGKQKQLAIGGYPEIGLKEAREKTEQARRLLRDGVDPSAKRRLDKITRAVTNATTFKSIADELLAKKAREGKAARTLQKLNWLMGIANPAIGDRPISEITPPEVLAVLRGVEARERLESAKRLRAVIGEVVRYAIATGRATTDPTYALRGALRTPTVKHRAAITDPLALGALLRAIDGFDGQPATRAALRLMPLLFPRPGELRMAEWSEFDFDGAVWVIPGNRTKMRREHRIPLTRQAIDILRALQPITGAGKLVFPGTRTALRPISENTLNAALRRMGYTPDEMTSHGFRASASTLLNESGKWNPDAIERALAHMDEDTVRRAYARGEHWEERVAMMAWWADHLDLLRASGMRPQAGALALAASAPSRSSPHSEPAK